MVLEKESETYKTQLPSLVTEEGKFVLIRAIEIQARKRLRWDSATSLTDLAAIRGNRLEALQADRAGQHSIRINDHWRICFVWFEGNPRNVEIVDYR